MRRQRRFGCNSSPPVRRKRSFYLQKQIEAQKFFAAYPTSASSQSGTDSAHWPFLSAEVGVTGASMWEVAATIDAKAATWLPTAAQIETIRLTAKSAVLAANTPDAVAAAQLLTWPSAPGGLAGS